MPHGYAGQCRADKHGAAGIVPAALRQLRNWQLPRDSVTMEQRLAEYLSSRLEGATEVAVDGLSRIHGGSSQETFRFTGRWRDAHGAHEHRLILRRAPLSGLVNAEADIEFRVYAALAGNGLPVPKAWWLELDPSWLERPFFIMDMLPGSAGSITAAEPYAGKELSVAADFWSYLGRLAAQDPVALGLTALRNAGESSRFWERELDYWEARLDAGEAVVEPIVRGAIRWLRRNPPPEAAKPAICHGDYRSGNFLWLPEGRITAILDWEMCHVSDPLEDVAWALNPMWSVEKLMPLDQAFARWEAESGVALDRHALEWWRLFACVKACGIWTTAEASFEDGTSREAIIALTALRASHFHRKEILERMAERGALG